LELHGNIPLPPYIKRAASTEDTERYQTVYAKHNGSVAAPTAGLHFSNELLARLADKNIAQHFVTLHVGGGTFLPVKVDDTSQHIMHSEHAIISSEVAEKLNYAKRQGKKIVAVGTTAMRTLESATDSDGVLHPFNTHTDIFITPSYQFRFVDKLITNFHLPKSTLFMLVCAFCGLEQMQAAYQHAIKQRYRFYSYGDACLLEKSIQQ
jgi:S-adenosylmethionine:tRNA ribosyltransferase-isomerase